MIQLVFFFLRIRHPPRSPLFPTPPLSRSAPPRRGGGPQLPLPAGPQHRPRVGRPDPGGPAPARAGDRGAAELPPRRHRLLERSEEHTSELQSRQYLVCRLLLEKKKTRVYA